MLIFGAILFVLGVLFCMTIIGAVIGLPLMFIGGFFMSIGMFTRRRTVITNIVQVAAAPQPAPIFHQPIPQAIPAFVPQAPIPTAAPASASLVHDAQTKNCAACASQNNADNRFCTECGAALPAA